MYYNEKLLFTKIYNIPNYIIIYNYLLNYFKNVKVYKYISLLIKIREKIVHNLF